LLNIDSLILSIDFRRIEDGRNINLFTVNIMAHPTLKPKERGLRLRIFWS